MTPAEAAAVKISDPVLVRHPVLRYVPGVVIYIVYPNHQGRAHGYQFGIEVDGQELSDVPARFVKQQRKQDWSPRAGSSRRMRER